MCNEHDPPQVSHRSEGDLQDQNLQDRLTAAQCLKNAHGHIATAYAQIGSPELDTPARRDRAVRETLDAVDWVRRALEHMSGSRHNAA